MLTSNKISAAAIAPAVSARATSSRTRTLACGLLLAALAICTSGTGARADTPDPQSWGFPPGTTIVQSFHYGDGSSTYWIKLPNGESRGVVIVDGAIRRYGGPEFVPPVATSGNPPDKPKDTYNVPGNNPMLDPHKKGFLFTKQSASLTSPKGQDLPGSGAVAPKQEVQTAKLETSPLKSETAAARPVLTEMTIGAPATKAVAPTIASPAPKMPTPLHLATPTIRTPMPNVVIPRIR